jgi:hypothetical protein
MVLLLARVIGVGAETADMLVQEVLSRTMRDRRASRATALCPKVYGCVPPPDRGKPADVFVPSYGFAPVRSGVMGSR